MRKQRLVAVVILWLAPAAFAQQRHAISLFATNSATTRAFGDYGAAISETWTPRFSTQVAMSVEDPEVCLGGSFLTRPCTRTVLRTYPVDVVGRYHFLNETRWKPFWGLGVRYVRAPRLTAELIAEVGREYPDHVDPQVVGGLEFLLRPALAITLEGKQLLADSESYDPMFKVSIGMTFRF
jgi:hypothetical protein